MKDEKTKEPFKEVYLTTDESKRWIKFYDSVKAEKTKLELMHAAQYFMDNFMRPYVEVLEGLL